MAALFSGLKGRGRGGAIAGLQEPSGSVQKFLSEEQQPQVNHGGQVGEKAAEQEGQGGGEGLGVQEPLPARQAEETEQTRLQSSDPFQSDRFRPVA